jgi:hypothetical protein
MLRALSFGVASIFVAGCGSPPMAEDAGSVDAFAPHDAPNAACTIDRECDDGVFCNGVETCSAGHCVARRVACDDGVACTVDECNEGSRSCVSHPPDLDMDGFDDGHCFGPDGVALGTDCDDHDANRFPTNPETCDAHDEDCDPTTVGGVDSDHDGAVPDTCCNPGPAGAPSCGGDCDDTSASVSHLATEICDTIDNDCDGMIDEHVLLSSWPDLDGDGFGDASATPVTVCLVPSSRANEGGDCDDTDRRVHPFQTEECNGDDDDCDTHVDETTAMACNGLSAGALGECIGGRCVVTSCDATHYDCNGVDADGCEASICSSGSTCGACGHVCGGGFTFCGGGLCPGFTASFAFASVLHDVTGAPVANARITSIGVCPVVTATTAADGSYVMGPMTSGASIWRVEAPGYPTHVQPQGTSADAIGPILTRALVDAWMADPDRAASPSPTRAILVVDSVGSFLNDGILGGGNDAMGMDLLSSPGGNRQVFFDVVPGRMSAGGSFSDGAGCFTNCGRQYQLYLEAGAVTFLPAIMCAELCA